MKDNIIFMISGKAGSGKSEVGNFLEKELEKDGYPVLRIAFGDAVKFCAKKFYGWDGDKNNPEGRKLLQTLATEKIRSRFPTFWGDFVAKFIAATQKDHVYVVIDDLRFQNEYQVISDYNTDVICIRVERYNENENQYSNPNMTEEQKNHISETELDHFPFDYVIENRGTLEDLHENVLTILEDFANN